jgi:hypothetical protein
MPLPGLSANFNEPQSDDTTSLQPMPQQAQPQQGLSQGLAAALAKRKQKAPGPTLRPTGQLAAMISRAKRARPSADKFG